MTSTDQNQMCSQFKRAHRAVFNGQMSESQVFSCLCQEWGIDEDEALEDLESTDIYGLLGYASYPNTSFHQYLRE